MDKQNIFPVLNWLVKSFEATDSKGSAHNYSHWLNEGNGWSKAYPETTGYIIETLLRYDPLFPQLSLKTLASQQAFWLLEQQLPSGAFTSGKIGSSSPSIFNSGQILFGLMDGWRLTSDPVFETAVTRCVNWLLDELDDNYKWSKHGWLNLAFSQNYNPTYYTRVIWPILEAADLFNQPQWTNWIYPCFEYYSNLQNDNLTYKNWSFHPNSKAYTHTIAYTLRGILESAVLLKDEQQIKNIKFTALRFIEIYNKHGQLAGSYDEDWKGDYSYICVTGHAQLSIFFSQLYQHTKVSDYHKMAISLFEDIKYSPKQGLFGSVKGGVPGSIPIYAKYNALRFPNWAAKFYLDAWWYLERGYCFLG